MRTVKATELQLCDVVRLECVTDRERNGDYAAEHDCGIYHTAAVVEAGPNGVSLARPFGVTDDCIREEPGGVRRVRHLVGIEVTWIPADSERTFPLIRRKQLQG